MNQINESNKPENENIIRINTIIKHVERKKRRAYESFYMRLKFIRRRVTFSSKNQSKF